MEINGLDKAGEWPRVSVFGLICALPGASLFATLLCPVIFLLISYIGNEYPAAKEWMWWQAAILFVILKGPVFAFIALVLGLPTMIWLIKTRRLSSKPVAIAGASLSLLVYVFGMLRMGCPDSDVPAHGFARMCQDGILTEAGWIAAGTEGLVFMVVGSAAALVCMLIYNWADD